MKQKSFTLIELLVVIAVIGLLSSIIIVNLRGTRGKANIARGLQFGQSVHNALGAYAVGVWNFDEGSGTAANDASGYNNHGTLTNGPVWRCANTDPNYTPSGQGCSIQFDGANDYIQVPQNTFLDITNDLTLGAWVKINTFITHGGIICYGPDGTDYETYSLNTYSGPNRISFRSNWPNTWYDLPTQTSLGTGVWYYIVATFQSGNVEIYLNGILDNSDTWGITALSLGTDRVLRFGENQPGGDEYFNGLIDEVHIYEKALTAGEIRQLYAEGAAKKGLALK
jgi:prepilin-type N-terminal cleavage/methylation domain-containing protein